MSSMKKLALQWVGGLVALCASNALYANTLQDINFSALPGNRVEVTLKLADAIPKPSSFSTENPARIVIDLPDTHSALKKKSMQIGVGVVQQITAVEAGGITRVVVDLVHAVDEKIHSQGDNIIIDIGGGDSGGIASLPAPKPQASSAVASMTPAGAGTGAAKAGGKRIENIGFRRGADGSGRIQITLSDPSIPVDVEQQGDKIVVDATGAHLPRSLERKLDVTDFATPVTTVTTRQDGSNTHMTIATKGQFEYLAYQTNDLYTVEVRPLTPQEVEKRRTSKKVFEGQRLSLNFQDIQVRSVLQLLADFTGLNMVVSDSVHGRITLRLKNVPWDQALSIILQTNGLSMRRNDNVILVAPTEELAAREKLDLESQKQIQELEPLHSELIQVNYAKASDLAKLLKNTSNKLLSSRGNVSVDTRTNSLLVQDTDSKLEEIRKLIAKLDVPVRQVLIQSRIVVANNDFARDLGVQLGISGVKASNLGGSNFLYAGGGLSGNYTVTSPDGKQVSFVTQQGSTNENLLVNLPQTLAAGSGGALEMVLGKVGSDLLQLQLSAMQQEGKGEVVSSPRIITSDQKTATITQGTEIPYQSATSSGATAVAFKKAVLELKVTPHITPDDRVLMDLDVSKDAPDFSRQVNGTPPINTQSLQTSVLVDNGETVVLGGVFQRNKTQSRASVPFFGDLPVVGWAFREKQVQDNDSELLIFVTPKILKDSLTLR